MPGGRRGLLAVAAILAPAIALAQTPADQSTTRGRLTDRYRRSPQGAQQLDDAVRKFHAAEQAERLEGIVALGQVGDAKAIDYLLGAASDPDRAIRVKAIDTLGSIKAKEATPVLVQQLFMRGTDTGTKQHILACLGKIGDPRATQPLLDFLARDEDPTTRANAIFALGDIGDAAALVSLQGIAESNDEDETLRGVAEAAIRKIQERPEPEVVPTALVDERERATR